MRYVGRMVIVLFLLAGLISCSRQEEKKGADNIVEKKEVQAESGEAKLPEGHPPLGGHGGQSVVSGKDIAGDIDQRGIGDINKSAAGHISSGGVKREVRVPDDVKAKWKAINLKWVDKEKKTEGLISVNVGKETPIKGTKFAMKVLVFLPHYTMYDTYVSSQSNEPVNPAVLVELLEEGRGVAKGWVFANFTSFNSYKHARYDIVLPSITSPDKKGG